LRANWSRIFAEAAQLNKAVEIDGYIDRQQLPEQTRATGAEGLSCQITNYLSHVTAKSATVIPGALNDGA
jgi:hypothetical protein